MGYGCTYVYITGRQKDGLGWERFVCNAAPPSQRLRRGNPGIEPGSLRFCFTCLLYASPSFLIGDFISFVFRAVFCTICGLYRTVVLLSPRPNTPSFFYDMDGGQFTLLLADTARLWYGCVRAGERELSFFYSSWPDS